VKLPDEVGFKEGANFFVNPMTAIGLLDISLNKHKSRTVIITAAAS